MKEFLASKLQVLPFLSSSEELASSILSLLIVLFIAYVSNFIAKKLILRFISNVIKQTNNQKDDIFLQHNVFSRLANLVPILVVYVLAPFAMDDYPAITEKINAVCLVFFVIVFMLILSSFIDALKAVYNSLDVSRKIPVENFAELTKLIIYLFGFVAILSLILGQSPLKLMAGMGAMTAVIMLVFKDAILGFAAGVRLSFNNLVNKGDWIEMKKFGVDGDIIEIGLTTVKVRNFDNTISTIPTYALVSESFKNWQGMHEQGGRRIKRFLKLDIRSIQFCDEDALQRYQKIQFVSDHIEQKQHEIKEHNASPEIDDSVIANGRRLTNIGIFRAYVEHYLKNHPHINQTMTVLVRQLQPTEHGLPIEVYAFSKETAWLSYEAVQSNIFDHILAVAPEFDLAIFQSLSSIENSNAL